MKHVRRHSTAAAAVLAAGLTCAAAAQQMASKSATMAATVPGILPSGFGDAVDRDVARARDATARYKDVNAAIAAGYPRTSDCIQYQPQGAMGYHHQNDTLRDATLEVDKPEVLVYEKMADGSFTLNGVEYLVPIDAWKRDTPPSIMGQNLKRADRLGIWYLHVWIWKASPTGLFADWNPDVKCS
jgi:hypothetical protein